MTEAPIFPLPAYKMPDNTCIVWCPACREYHNHGCGAQRDRPGGHRSAHCPSHRLWRGQLIEFFAPFRESGYELIDAGDAAEAVAADGGTILADSARPRPLGP